MIKSFTDVQDKLRVESLGWREIRVAELFTLYSLLYTAATKELP